jgi:Mn-dependent DtxR family transcriptional regulator
MTLDRLAGEERAVTQELISNMLGVQRGAVSAAALNLQMEGIIDFERGRLIVLDRAGLESCTCECYELMRAEYDRLLPRLHPRE